MYRRYRYFVYFLAALVLGSILLGWLSGSIRFPSRTRVEEMFAPLPTPAGAPAANPSQPSESAAARPYAPSYENESVSEREASKVGETQPPSQPAPPPIQSSSDLPPPAPPPSLSADEPAAPDSSQYSTSPKSSNAALREKLKRSKGR